MAKKLITFCIFLGAIFGSYYLYQQPSYPELSDKLTFNRIDGVQQYFEEFKGKPLLVTFWSPSCILCMKEVTHYNQLYRELQGGKEFELLALSMYYDRPDWVIESSRDYKMNYPVYFDLQKKLSRAFGNIVATPTSFLLNSNGEIIYRRVGKSDFALLQQKIKELTG